MPILAPDERTMRVRIWFTKSGALIYTGNLDLYTLWERAARRAGLALAYSKSFHPQPKIHFAAPLPLGYTSNCEVVDIRLDTDIDLNQMQTRLNSSLPEGLQVLRVERIEDGAPAVQTQVLSADYLVTLRESPGSSDLEARVAGLMSTSNIFRQRRDRKYDLRPLIESLEVFTPDAAGRLALRMTLKAQEGATGRPDEVLRALEIPPESARIERTALHLKTDLASSGSTAG